ncbi:23S rRNA (guanine(745)-N(1))-methyltransferase [invertebrate metagenome]|uniref:23S rRNA (Guanine(745)-N(1))-methyltransferase n=1 Tax=invertebrate metagenome TaxID=1711999 RepID=A0A2H9T422_9ZZZZ
MSLSLRCPVCHTPLGTLEPKNGGGAFCPAGHRFDRARQGYLNLLLSNKMNSKKPGDDKQMVQARTRFLDSGHYAPVSSALTRTVKKLVSDADRPVILDAGCGEGYYTDEIHKALPNAIMGGVDISKPAIIQCCRRNREIHWLVASVNDLPVTGNQVDVIVSVFSRCDWQEFSRVLKPSGHVVVVALGEKHLLALREVIYESVRPYPVDKIINNLPDGFLNTENQDIVSNMRLGSSSQILDLLAMTPHYWHVKSAQKVRLSQLSSLVCDIDMRCYVIKYSPNTKC